MNNPTHFLGTWHLIPEKSDYAHGTPPVAATYQFQSGEKGSLAVSIQWTDAEGQSLGVDYTIIPDGKKRAYENPAVADEVMSEFESDRVLNSMTYRSGAVIAFATRIIDETGMMKVLQRFYTPDGNHFDNLQYYKQ
ncbi:MAG: hypothetical protein KDC44_15780 [Phaeodactylibacter sp.]|nr:hypothetical protein [Phaeodactylibacter sp.]